MGQQDVFKHLSKTKWKSTRQLSEEMPNSRSCISTALRKLYKYGDIERKKDKYKYHWIYRYKRK